MLVGFQKMTVAKDQELRNQLREAGVSYEVVKNTLARKAAEGTALEQAADQFKGVTAVALSTGDPVVCRKRFRSLPRPIRTSLRSRPASSKARWSR
jgi:large subunit ribosomal protein L10